MDLRTARVLLTGGAGGIGGAIAEALLGITDDRAARAPGGVVKKSYEKLRPTAKKHVEEAVPGVARLIDKHTR